MKHAVSLRPYGFFRITWIKGHLDKPEHKHYITNDIFTQEEANWHIECDKMADKGSQDPTISKNVYESYKAQ